MPTGLRQLVALVLAAASLTFATSCSSGDSADDAAAAGGRPPVVMIVFDEFSTISLLGADGRIDAVRYPAFAQLAREGTWFPYATASLDETGRAMRSLFTGKTTTRYAKPNYAQNPRNIFTLMARKYGLNVSEEVTSLCPRRLCPSSRQQTQRSILHKLASGRAERFDRWVRSVRARSRPTFYFKHLLFPHAPWKYLPSGRHYEDGPTQDAFSWEFEHSNSWLIKQRYQQHLLQVGFTDRLLGRALQRLRATGLYDRALIVLTADNGESFGRAGNGHEIGGQNATDIALTPLFVKLPHQRKGQVVRRHVRTIDVLPTIARVARIRPDRSVEGRSVFGAPARRIPSTTLLVQRSGRRIRVSLGVLRRKAAASLRLKLKLFGAGNGKPGLYAVGPYANLYATQVTRSRSLPASGTRAVLDLPERFLRARLASGFLPVKVMGRLTGPGSNTPANVAIAINGTIAATAPTVAPQRGGTQYFTALVPESALREGRNDVRVLAIVPVAGGVGLRPLNPGRARPHGRRIGFESTIGR